MILIDYAFYCDTFGPNSSSATIVHRFDAGLEAVVIDIAMSFVEWLVDCRFRVL